MEDAEVKQEEMEEVERKPVPEEGSEEESPSPEPESGQEETPEEKSNKPEKAEKSKEELSLQAQKVRYREKYEAAMSKLEKYEKSSKKTDKADLPATTSPMETVKLAKALQGFNEDEIDFIVRNATGSTVSDIIETTKDDWVKTAIDAKRKKVEEENQTPSPSSPSSTLSGKTEKDIEKMDDAVYSQWLKGAVEKSGTRRGV